MILGISSGFHDAAASVINKNGDILFAAHSERSSRKKHDPTLDESLIHDILVLTNFNIQKVAYHENPLLKKTRELYAGQLIEHKGWTAKRYLLSSCPALTVLANHDVPFVSTTHHLSHAAAGFQTSPFNEATVVVIDAIGEWDTVGIYAASYNKKGIAKYKKLWSQKYPNSIGLLYSAFTQRLGLRPGDEEYIVMGMAGYGKPTHAAKIINDYVNIDFTLKENVHCGIPDDYLQDANEFDIASSIQFVAEQMISGIMRKAYSFKYSSNLVYMGGVALNCLANRNLGNYFENVWVMPNPGDAGSSLGAAAYAYGKKINWQNPYLGHNINKPYPVQDLICTLQTDKIAGVANGRAEFGPRALGNRSLLADPRGNDIKDRVNDIKRRQQFRPFAPVILEEHVDDYFNMPQHSKTSPYMQVVAKCKFPEQFPAIIHVDGTSRVQTVAKNCGSGIRELLEEWYRVTECPMLLNTSLNIRCEPMVNTWADAIRFQETYNVKVF